MGVGISRSGVQYTLNTTEVHAVAFQMGHTRGNGSGVNMTGKAYSLEAVGNANQAVVTGIFRLDPSKGQGGMAIVEDVGHGSTGS